MSAKYIYLLSALIPLGMMMMVMYHLEITPFGENTLVFLDAEAQYLPFFSYLQSVFRGENDLLYTFSKSMGGNMISLASYYLLSPFYVVFAFFTRENLPAAFSLVVLLKISACGLCFYHASARLYGHNWLHLAFSTAYALMAYNTVYCWNLMWLDGVLILPLMSLGLTALWKEGKWRLYAVSIAYGLITNFYIGYMLCAASVLFCLAWMLLDTGNLRSKLRTFGKYAAASCVGGFAGSVVWLPAVLSMLGSRAGAENQALDFAHSYTFSGFFSSFLSGTLSWRAVFMGQPHIFCGSMVMLLVGIFFLSRRTPLREKAVAAAVVLVFLLSFRLRILDEAWHGFSPNRSFNYRYSFLFSFVLIRIAQDTLYREKTLPRLSVIASFAAVMAVYILGYLEGQVAQDTGVLSNVLTVTVCMAVLLLWGKKKAKVLPLALTVLCIAEVGFALYLNWGFMEESLSHLTRKEHTELLQSKEPVLEELRQQNDGFYRIEQSISGGANDPMRYGYNGLSHFSSADKQEVMTFLEKMGFKNCYDIWSYYGYGSTADADALLGVKYIMSQQDLSAVKGYPLLTEKNGTCVYENPNALPIAMVASPDIHEVSMDGMDYFALHNDIWSGLVGKPTKVLLKEENVVRSFENLQLVSEEEGMGYYVKIEEEAPASVRWDITVSKEKPLYVYFTSVLDDQDVFIRSAGQDNGIYFNANRWDMFTVGTYAPGQTITVEMELTRNDLVLGDGYFYYEDCNAVAEAAGAIRQSPVQLRKEASSRLSGSFTAEKDSTLLFTIPYDPGWRVALDGKIVDAQQVLDCLLAVRVTGGNHSFEISFVPQGMVSGGILTVSALGLFALWSFLDRKQRRA